MSSELPLYAALALGAGPVLFYRGFRDLRLKRTIEDTPTSNIRSMAMGFVEVKGKATPRSHLVAPFSANPCAYWEVDVATKSGRRGGWTIIHRAQSRHPFYLEDETGIALVYPDGAKCTVPHGREEECAGLMLPEPYVSYLKEHGGLGLQVARLGALRFRERLIEPGQPVYVLGSAFPRAQSVSLSDDESLAATGTDDAVATRLRATDQRIVGVIRKGQNDPTFLISPQSELALVVTLGMKCVAQLVAGPALTLFGLGYWLSVLKAGRLL